MDTILTVILGSSVISAFVAIFFASRDSERKISIENITMERTKWRDKVRALSLSTVEAISSGDKVQILALRAELSLRLNPNDEFDNYIVGLVCVVPENQRSAATEKFTASVAQVLKHDWDRSKLEASSIFGRLKLTRSVLKKAFYEVPSLEVPKDPT
ncbi:hypothetical protein ASC74_07510 [Pseudomonas sp. Root329]|uniref:hypothetical protein n=1 Tax=Pseudomonas sp. Root329 TaxID=1736515 RepID=UPI0006F569A9|nr:hypothetical protein [Pseudomonas sp. Root329]KQV12947.1 hypothetical protein ASC74_07510 [Pseudomonas sp. Root329]